MREGVVNRPHPGHFQDRGTGEPWRLDDYRYPPVGESVARIDLIPDNLVLDWNNRRPLMGQLRQLVEACPRRDPCAAYGTPCVHLKVIKRGPC